MKKEEQYRRINTLEYNKIVQSIPLLNKIANYFKDYFFGKKVVYCTSNQKLQYIFQKVILCIYVAYIIQEEQKTSF